MTKQLLAVALAASAILFAGCNNFLSEPPGSVAVTLSAAPTVTAGITDCAIAWRTNVATKHILEYGTATGVYTVATPLTSSDSKDHAASLESLLPSMTYYYRVRSYYQNTQETDSTEYTFTTGALTSVTIVAGPTLTVGQTSCDLSWTTNVATKHTIEYGTVSGAYSAATVLSAAASTANSDSITGLAPATTYYYRIRSTYQNSLEGLSAEASFTTLARTPLAIGSGPAATPTATTCALAWTTNLSTTHIVEYGTVSGTYTIATVQTSAAALANSESLTDLAPATTYYYRIRSFATDGQTATSAQASFTTLAGAATLAFSAGPTATPSLTSASIAYTTNYATTSSIEYGTASGTYTSSLTLDASLTNHTRSISGLTAGTTYYYVVRCYSAANGNVTSTEQSFTTTSETAPTSVQRARGIWLIGGCSGANWTSAVGQIDLFDPVTSTWYTSVATLPTPVSFAAVGTGIAGSGHRVLVIAGGFNSAGTALNTVQRYDIDDQAWLANGTVIPAARANVVGATRNNCLYVVGGTSGNATAAWAAGATDYEYNIGGDSWTTKVAVTAGSERATAAFDDEIVYAGGRTAAASPPSTVVDGILTLQNLLTSGYTELALGTARTGHSLVTYTPSSGSTALIVMGGFSAYTGTPTCFFFNGGTGGTLQNTAQYIRYPFFTPSAWAACANLPATVAFGSAIVYGNTLYYFGGTTSYTASGTATVYTTDLTAIPASGAAANVWLTMGTSMPAVRYGHAAVKF